MSSSSSSVSSVSSEKLHSYLRAVQSRSKEISSTFSTLDLSRPPYNWNHLIRPLGLLSQQFSLLHEDFASSEDYADGRAFARSALVLPLSGGLDVKERLRVNPNLEIVQKEQQDRNEFNESRTQIQRKTSNINQENEEESEADNENKMDEESTDNDSSDKKKWEEMSAEQLEQRILAYHLSCSQIAALSKLTSEQLKQNDFFKTNLVNNQAASTTVTATHKKIDEEEVQKALKFFMTGAGLRNTGAVTGPTSVPTSSAASS